MPAFRTPGQDTACAAVSSSACLLFIENWPWITSLIPAHHTTSQWHMTNHGMMMVAITRWCSQRACGACYIFYTKWFRHRVQSTNSSHTSLVYKHCLGQLGRVHLLIRQSPQFHRFRGNIIAFSTPMTGCKLYREVPILEIQSFNLGLAVLKQNCILHPPPYYS